MGLLPKLRQRLEKIYFMDAVFLLTFLICIYLPNLPPLPALQTCSHRKLSQYLKLLENPQSQPLCSLSTALLPLPLPVLHHTLPASSWNLHQHINPTTIKRVSRTLASPVKRDLFFLI